MNLPYQLPLNLNWLEIPEEKVNGEIGFAKIKTQLLGDIKIRKVEYAKNYLADHWCDKGHIVFVIEGQLILEHQDQSIQIIDAGMTYIVGDNSMSHKAKSKQGALVYIVD
jgi:hypothetical protein